jgi:hypothetical protein
MLYNTLWYFPVLMVVGGTSTIVWDYRWLQNFARRFRPARQTEQTLPQDVEATDNAVELTETASDHLPARRSQASSSQTGRHTNAAQQSRSPSAHSSGNDLTTRDDEQERIVPQALQMRVFSWKFGATIIACFFITFTVIMVLRGVLPNRPRGLSLFANLYLAGTIIFGGGPVVIPLLRESVY